MADVIVLATAGLKPGQLEDVDHIHFPRVDYLELRRYLDVKIINYDVYNRTRLGHYLRYGETHLHSDIYLTLLGFVAQRRARVVFAMSERAGIPFAGFKKLIHNRKKLVSMFQSWSWRQELVVSKFNLLSQMNAIAVHCTSMLEKITELGAEPEKIRIVPYSTDQNFFSPRHGIEQQSNLIFSLGEPRSRNYSLLFEAVSDLPVKLVAATSGMWYAREKRREISTQIPDNVETLRHLPLGELRNMYSKCSFVVLPVYEQVSSAGATGTLEAACMERAVIATRSPGLRDFIIDGETGILVEPNDLQALREAILYLHSHPEEARRMGRNARLRVEAFYNFDHYVESLARLVSNTI
jgi:glycosyltransferase involved in cell wall biosynthesis